MTRNARARLAFTLVEIAIATLILVTAALVVLMLLPGALKSQQKARYQMLAAAHAQSAMAAFYQHEFDLREVNGSYGPGGAGVPVPDGNGIRDALVNRRMMSAMGHFDLERVITNRMHGNYPVPLDIARRLDSPNDEIRKVLDNGGYIYYSDPLAGGRSDDKQRRFSQDKNERGDASRMVWAVVGNAQQNLLPFNPWAEPHQELYPFPPISRPRGVDRFYQGQIAYGWEKHGASKMEKDTVTGKDIEVQDYHLVERGDSFFVRDAQYPRGMNGTASPGKAHLYGREEESFYQTNNWEWLATQDPGSPWAEGLDAYRRLVNQHWLRILDQIASIHVTVTAATLGSGSGSNGTGQGTRKFTWELVTKKRYIYKTREDSDGKELRDEYGQPYWDRVEIEEKEWVKREVEEKPGGGEVVRREVGGRGAKAAGNGVDIGAGNPLVETWLDTYFTTWRGYPAPAKGVPTSTLRGSDLLWEDAAACDEDLAGQLRISLPSLERRIAYRSSALALWAKVAYGKDIVDANDVNKIHIQGGTPPGAGKDALQNTENPLSSDFRMPSNMHPTHVLALSYVAHAAMMVTGYKPPFYHNGNTLTAHDDQLLVPEGKDDVLGDVYAKLPYRPVEATWLVDNRGRNLTTELELLRKGGGFATVTVAADGSIVLTGLGGDLDDSLKAPINPPLINSGRFVDRDGFITDNPIILKGYCWLNNPYNPNNIEPEEKNTRDENETIKNDVVTIRLHSESMLTSGDPRDYQLDAETGRPISHRRMVGGIINRFPPPYADQDSVDIEGRPTYTERWQLAVTWRQGDAKDPADPTKPIKDPADTKGEKNLQCWLPEFRLIRKLDPVRMDADTDSQYAARAHEHALTAAMAYASANPYDLTVPKPLNRQTFIDRGIYQFDLFDASGRAIRPQAITGTNRRFQSRYPITFLGQEHGARKDRVNFGVQRAEPVLIDSVVDYKGHRHPKNNKFTDYGHRISTALEPEVTGRPFPFGCVVTGLAGDRCKDPYQNQNNFATWVDLTHGHRERVVATNSDAPARPDRATAIGSFAAQDRCRQLVYWMVDWQRYVDAETAPSAPVDYAYLRRQQKAPFIYGKVVSYDPRAKAGWHLRIDLGHDEDGAHFGYAPGQTITLRHGSTDPVEVTLDGFDRNLKGKQWYFIEQGAGDLSAFQALVGTTGYINHQQGSQDSSSEERWLERFLGGNPEIDFVWVDPERTATTVRWNNDKAKLYKYSDYFDKNQSKGGIGETNLGYLASGHRALPLNDIRVRVNTDFWSQRRDKKNGDKLMFNPDGTPIMDNHPQVQSDAIVTQEFREMNPFLALGAFGADRDGNGRYEPSKHPVSTTTRMQAAEICRFTFYDPVAWISLGR